METKNFIEKLHNGLWFNSEQLLKSEVAFDTNIGFVYPHENIPDKWGSSKYDVKISLQRYFNAIIKKYGKEYNRVCKKFKIEDYTFYILSDTQIIKRNYYRTDNKDEYRYFNVYMEYKGYTKMVFSMCFSEIYTDKQDGDSFYVEDMTEENKDKRSSTHQKWYFEGYYTVLHFMKNVENIELLDYNFKDVFGEWELKRKDEYSGGMYPKNLDINTEETKSLDLNHFIEMYTSNGIYKPKSEFFKIFKSPSKPKLQGKKLKDLGVKVIDFSKNTIYDIDMYYDLEDVVIKCHVSLIKEHQDLAKYHRNKEKALDVVRKEKERQEEIKRQEQEEIKRDTYSLYQFGVPILKDVRSSVIEDYLTNKNNEKFNQQAISAAKKVFSVTDEIDTIYFMRYGIYTYTECAGEKFVSYEDIDSINELKGNKLPKNVIELCNQDVIDFPYFNEDDISIDFEKGATYIGVKKIGNNYTVIYEAGEQGI